MKPINFKNIKNVKLIYVFKICCETEKIIAISHGRKLQETILRLHQLMVEAWATAAAQMRVRFWMFSSVGGVCWTPQGGSFLSSQLGVYRTPQGESFSDSSGRGFQTAKRQLFFGLFLGCVRWFPLRAPQ